MVITRGNNPANIYLFKSMVETLEKGVKYVNVNN